MRTFLRAADYEAIVELLVREKVGTLERLNEILMRSAVEGLYNIIVNIDSSKIEIFKKELENHGYAVGVYSHRSDVYLNIIPDDSEDFYLKKISDLDFSEKIGVTENPSWD